MGENNEGLLGKSDGAGKRLFREMPSTEGVSEIKLFVGVGWVVGNQQVTQGSILINLFIFYYYYYYGFDFNGGPLAPGQ